MQPIDDDLGFLGYGFEEIFLQDTMMLMLRNLYPQESLGIDVELNGSNDSLVGRVNSNLRVITSYSARSFSDLTLEEQDKYFIRSEMMGSKELQTNSQEKHPTIGIAEVDDNESQSGTAMQKNITDPSALYVGMELEANYAERGQWYPARIAAINRNEAEDGVVFYSFDIDYDYGDIESGVKLDCLRYAPPPIAAEESVGTVSLPENSLHADTLNPDFLSEIESLMQEVRQHQASLHNIAESNLTLLEELKLFRSYL